MRYRKPPEDDYAAHVRLSGNVIWVVFCRECDAWHSIAVLTSAEVRIIPGIKRKAKYLGDIQIVCGRCEQSILYLLDEERQRDICRTARVE